MANKKHGEFTGDWYDERNARRRARYRKDKATKDIARQKSRDAYREKVGIEAKMPKMSEFKARLTDNGDTRLVSPQGVEVKCYTCEEVGAVFDTNVKQVRRWIESDKLPAPVLKTILNGRFATKVYSHPEVVAMVSVLGAHFEQVLYFRNDHTQVIHDLRDAVKKARREWKARYVN